MWRPEGWKNPWWEPNPNLEPDQWEMVEGERANAFEEGADAMLEALCRVCQQDEEKWMVFRKDSNGGISIKIMVNEFIMIPSEG